MADERPRGALSANTTKASVRKTATARSGKTAAKRSAVQGPATATPPGTRTAKRATTRGVTGKRAPAKQAAAKSQPAKPAAPRARTARRTPAAKPTAQRQSERATGGTPDWAAGAAQLVAVGAPKAVEMVSVPVTGARRVLDRAGGLPAYVGAGLLAAAGVIHWPVAAGAGVGYAALRRWGADLPEPLRSLTGSRRGGASTT